MEEILARLWHDLSARPDGPLAFRLYLQPTMAAIVACRDGIRDAKGGRPPYLWALLFHRDRRELLRDGFRSIAKIALMALLVDALYQVLVLKHLYPGESLVVVVLLAVLPYALFRGPINRALRHRYRARDIARDEAA